MVLVTDSVRGSEPVRLAWSRTMSAQLIYLASQSAKANTSVPVSWLSENINLIVGR